MTENIEAAHGAPDPRTLSDDHLIEEVKRLARSECRAIAALIRSLMELDARSLYLREGCSSLFTYCTQVLHLSESAAYNRIEAARAARRFPVLLDQVETGELTLTAVRLLAPHLTNENCDEAIASARYGGKQAIEELVARLSPRPAATNVVRRLPTSVPPLMVTVERPSADDSPHAEMPSTRESPRRSEMVSGPILSTPSSGSPMQQRAVVQPLAPERYRLQVTLSREGHAKLRHAQAMLRRVVPNGDLAEIVEKALTLLVEHLERRRFARACSPRQAAATPMGSRRIPATVRRAVWARDEGRCAFVGREGRCRETGFLEFHHLEPYALGGASTVENIQLRCRAHNQYEARLVFGDVVRETTPPWPAPQYNEGAPGWRNWQTLGT